MELKCTFYDEGWWPQNRLKYTCRIDNQPLTDRKVSSFIGKHIDSERGNTEVTAIWFDACQMSRLPKNLIDFFPNLETMFVHKCGLKSLSGDDLSRVPKLQQILFIGNDFSSLSDDLLSGLKQLEFVSLNENKIAKICPKMFKKMSSSKVKFIDLRNNLCINAVYAKETSLFPIDDDYLRVSSLRKLIKVIKNENQQNSNENYLINDIKSLLADEKFKDFSIIIGNEEFKVHKFILTARSPIIADMILKNPTCTQIKLMDISVDAFRALIDYIYRDKLPLDDANLIDIFGAACKLNIRGLRDHARDNLIDITCEHNALEILILSSRYGEEELMVKAFEEIRKMFPLKRLKGELMNEPEKIREMIVAKRQMDEHVKKVKEEFDNLDVFK